MKKTTNLLLLIGLNFSVILAQPNYPSEPSEAQLVYSDIENFVSAFKLLAPGADTLAILEKNYINEASAGLSEYISRHGLTSEMIKDAIVKDRNSYLKLEKFLQEIHKTEDQFKMVMDKYDQIVENAMYPPTYLLVGANRGIAQASRPGQLVTVTRVVNDRDKLINLIVHELTHFQQAMTMGMGAYQGLYAQENNMLGLCLREGGAEFITSMVTGEITQNKTKAYFDENEEILKVRFVADLKDQNQSYWLWETVGSDTPQLLGYVMGYTISKEYYEHAENKEDAIRDILGIADPEKILDLSNYLK